MCKIMSAPIVAVAAGGAMAIALMVGCVADMLQQKVPNLFAHLVGSLVMDISDRIVVMAQGA
jgi:hypothetical protein